MAMTRSETAALAGVALLHLALFAWLSLSLPEPADLDRPPMAVEIIAEPAAVSTAPEISSEEPAAALGEPDLPPEPAPPEPAPPQPAPPRPAPPPPTPKVEPDRAREQQRVERERAAQTERRRIERERQQQTERERTERERTTRTERERTERERRARAETERRARQERERLAREARNRTGGDPLGNIESEVRNANGRNPNPPARQTAAQVRQSIAVAIDREILPFWRRNVPTGVDIEQLSVTLEIRLNRNGSIASVTQVGPLAGRTESNAPQQQRFVEQAIRSVRQVGTFALPAEHYDQWAVVTQRFRVTR